MKKSKFIIMILLFGVLFSCSKETIDPNIETLNLDVQIKNDETYEYNLGSFGDEVGAGIKTQAENFEKSEIIRDWNSGETVYLYKPKSDFIGIDFTEISIGGFNVASGKSETYRIIKMKINISE